MKRAEFGVVLLTFAIAAALFVLAPQGNTKASHRFGETPALSPAAPVPAHQTNPDPVSAEEYAVYAALINAEGRAGGEDRLLVIREQPSPWVSSVDEGQGDFYDELKKSSPALKAETVDDLRAKNKEASKFTRNFDISRPYVLISEEEVNGLFKQGISGWKSFHLKYPKSGGLSTFSRVGFDRDRTQALVYHGYSCGGLCGGGSYYLLTRKNGVWILKGNIGPSWVS